MKIELEVGTEIGKALNKAMESGNWLIAVAHVDSNKKLNYSYETHDFQNDIGITIDKIYRLIIETESKKEKKPEGHSIWR